MKETGFATFEAMEVQVKFRDVEKMVAAVQSINDTWRLPVDAEIRGIAINAEQLDLMPWEKLVLGGSMVPGVPETLKVPEECLTAARKCRAMALDVLGPDADSMTLSDMRKTISKKTANSYTHRIGRGNLEET